MCAVLGAGIGHHNIAAACVRGQIFIGKRGVQGLPHHSPLPVFVPFYGIALRACGGVPAKAHAVCRCKRVGVLRRFAERRGGNIRLRAYRRIPYLPVYGAVGHYMIAVPRLGQAGRIRVRKRGGLQKNIPAAGGGVIFFYGIAVRIRRGAPGKAHLVGADCARRHLRRGVDVPRLGYCRLRRNGRKMYCSVKLRVGHNMIAVAFSRRPV